MFRVLSQNSSGLLLFPEERYIGLFVKEGLHLIVDLLAQKSELFSVFSKFDLFFCAGNPFFNPDRLSVLIHGNEYDHAMGFLLKLFSEIS